MYGQCNVVWIIWTVSLSDPFVLMEQQYKRSTLCNDQISDVSPNKITVKETVIDENHATEAL